MVIIYNTTLNSSDNLFCYPAPLKLQPNGVIQMCYYYYYYYYYPPDNNHSSDDVYWRGGVDSVTK